MALFTFAMWIFHFFPARNSTEIWGELSCLFVSFSFALCGELALRLPLRPHLAAGAAEVRTDGGVCLERSPFPVDFPLGGTLFRRDGNLQQPFGGGDHLQRHSPGGTE